MVSRTAKRAELGHWSVHELRHTAGSLMLDAGIRLEVVSRILGHSSIRVTADVYGHEMPPVGREAAEAMQAAIFS
jgi:integrase